MIEYLWQVSKFTIGTVKERSAKTKFHFDICHEFLKAKFFVIFELEIFEFNFLILNLYKFIFIFLITVHSPSLSDHFTDHSPEGQ